jgi:mRNA-degrading endonuclease toxin of MazEF toxin-antitoxin module
MPEDETVLTVVRGVVVSVELIRRRPATVLATSRVHPRRSLVVVSFR